MVRYTVHPEQAEENERLIKAILDEVGTVRPPGLRYAAYKLDDGVTFVHLIDHDRSAGHMPGGELGSLPRLPCRPQREVRFSANPVSTGDVG